jgi:hypothetical protein
MFIPGMCQHVFHEASTHPAALGFRHYRKWANAGNGGILPQEIAA